MEPGVASTNRARSANRQRGHRNGRKGVRRGPKIPGVDQADASGSREVQSPGSRVVRDAVSERYSLPVRLDKVRQGIRLRGNSLPRRSPNRRRFLQAEGVKCPDESTGELFLDDGQTVSYPDPVESRSRRVSKLVSFGTSLRSLCDPQLMAPEILSRFSCRKADARDCL